MTRALFGLTAATLVVLGTAAQARELNLYTGNPQLGTHIIVTDLEGKTELLGGSVTVPKPEKPRVPDSRVEASRKGNTLNLHWAQAWYASLAIQRDQPLDLRPLLKHGTLEFDIDILDLAEGDLNFVMSCGKDCSRRVPFLREGRALQGKGWQHLSFALSCFERDGADFSAITQPVAFGTTGTGEVVVKNIRLRSSGKPKDSCVDYRTESVTARPLERAWSMPWWIPRHEQKLKDAREVPDRDLVFIGDSITQGWENSGAPVWERNYAKYKALNLGFSGDLTENVLWRLQHGELDALHPKVVVMMIGTNNTGDRQEDPATTAIGVKRLVEEVRSRLPQAKLLVLAVFPRDEKPDSRLRLINDGVNERIAKFADGQHIFFLDINAAFVQSDGTLTRDIMPDLLHPNEKGYDIWAKAMQPTLEKLINLP